MSEAEMVDMLFVIGLAYGVVMGFVVEITFNYFLRK